MAAVEHVCTVSVHHCSGVAAVPTERRKDPRVDVELSVSMQSDSNFYTGLLENISLGGVFIATETAFSVGTRLNLTIDLEDGLAPMRVAGQVRWLRCCSPRGVGVRFIDLAGAELTRVRSFTNRREPGFFEE